MNKTYRMQRGFASFILICTFIALWFFFYRPYPQIAEKIPTIQLPHIEPNIFLVLAELVVGGLLICWSIRNKLFLGLPFALRYYSIVKRLRRQIKNARFEDENEFSKRLVSLPEIKISFIDNRIRTSGIVQIRNSIKFHKKLENIKIDSALKEYVIERQYLSQDRNWYVFEFFLVGSQKQLVIKSKNNLIEWSRETANDYELRLDERTTVPFHHMGLVGQTGSGKSFFIQMVCDQVLSKSFSHEIFIIDPKRTDVYQMAKRALGVERTADKTNAIELITRFHERMKKRQDELQEFFATNRNKTYKEAGLPALILLIDEFGALRESWKTMSKKERDEIDSILSDVAFMGRQLGCILWIATQQMNAQTMPTAIREQLVLKIALGDSDEQTYRTLFASGVDIPPVLFGAGQGVCSFPSVASVDNPRLLVVPFCTFLNEDA